jgi:hypothetical protein
MDCYVFVSATATAFTIDPAGFNLPTHRGPWHYIRKAGDGELRRREIQEVMQGLQTDGLVVINK